MAVSDLSASGFVGRESELRALLAALDDARAGRGRCVLLSGEPGIGKTRTAEALEWHARQAGTQVIWGRCYEGEGAPAFWPWVQILRTCTKDLDTTTLREMLGSGGTDVAQVLPQLRERLIELPPSADLESPHARFRVFDSITRFFANLAQSQPLVLVIDDLHGADRTSLLMLDFLVRELRHLPLLLLATFRTTASRELPALGATLAELLRASATQQLTLGGLSEKDVERFIELTTNRRPSRALLSALHRQTEGNPLFVAEFVRVWTAGPSLRPDAVSGDLTVPIPESVRAVITQRLAQLTPTCREVLTLAAIVGREFRADTIERAFGTPAVSDALREAVDERVVAASPGPLNAYRFAHALIRETLYDAVPAVRRAELHQRVAVAIEQLDASSDRFAELAYHFAAAGYAGDSTKAVHYARQAAQHAFSVLAYEEAGRLYELALGTLGGGGDERARCELLLALGRVHNIIAGRKHAQATFLQAATSARLLATHDGSAAAAPLLARAALGFGGDTGGHVEVTQVTTLPPSLFDPDLVNLIHEALDALPADDVRYRPRLVSRLAVARYNAEPLAWRDDLTAQALAMARRGGDAETLAYVLCLRHIAIWGPHNTAERLTVLDEMLPLAEAAGDLSLATMARGWRAFALFETCEMDAMERELALFTRAVHDTRQPYFQWIHTLWQGMRAFLAGRFAEAEQLADTARDLGRQGRTAADMFRQFQIAALRCEQDRLGDIEPFLAMLKAGADLYPSIPSTRTALALLCLELDRPEEARVQFESLAADGFSFPEDTAWLNSMVEAAAVCAGLGDISAARTLYRLLRPYAKHNVLAIGAITCRGSAARALAQLAVVLQQWDDAATHFETALTVNRALGAPVWVAHTQADYAAMLLARGRSGDEERAKGLLDQALMTARTLGMTRLERVVAALPPRTSIVSESPSSPPPDTSQSNLFRREGDYWTIAYAGDVVRLRDTRGLHYLAYLLGHPGQEFHTLDLVVTVSPSGIGGGAQRGPRDPQDGLPVLDVKAKAAYKGRLDALRSELTEAEQFNDAGRANRLREEMELLAQELSAALGLGGRDRRTGSDVERARLMVTKRIKDAIKKIRDSHPDLAHHLATSVKTGYYCAYAPGAAPAGGWQVPDQYARDLSDLS